MPNTIAHLGVQSLATRAAVRDAELCWIYLGCVLPDLPWVVHRALKAVAVRVRPFEQPIATGSAPAVLPVGVDLYDLRLYAVIQASLFFCLVLAGAFAAVAHRPRRVFGILAGGAVVHLLLDATQTKWGNGVQLLAPIDWRVVNFGWYWPESLVSVLLTLLGLAYFLITLPQAVASPPRRSRPARWTLGAVLLAIWLVAPPLFFGSALDADAHSIATLGAPERRGLEVELHRAFVRPTPEGTVARTMVEEELVLGGLQVAEPQRRSVRGLFVDHRRVEVLDSHRHRPGPRDAASVVGLSMVALVWIAAWWRGRRRAWSAITEPPSEHSTGPHTS